MKELELILQTVASLGAAGKEAFIWWLIVSYGVPFIGFLVGALAVTKIARMIYDSGDDTSCLTRIAKVLEISNDYGGFSRNEVYEKVRELAKRQS